MAEGVGDTPMEAASPSRASLALGFVSELGKEISAAFAAVWTRSLSAGAEHGFTLLSEQPSEQSGQLEAGRGTAPSCQRPEEQSSADEGNSGNSNNNNHRKLWHTQPEFQGAVFVAILLNTLLVTVKASFIQASSVRYFSGIAENTFTVFFALELILRIFEHGSFASYFCGKAAGWNLFDFLVTGVGIAEGLLQLLTKEADTHLKMVQVIRLFRVLRMLRLLRAIRFLSEVDYVVRLAFRTMFYYGLLLLLAQFMFAIWATNLLWDFPDQQIAGMFSSLGDSMWTLFCLMTLDGWIAIVNVILEQEPYMLVFFTFFIFFSVSAVSIVPAIFIEVHSQAREARLIKEAQQASGARQGSKRTSSKPRPRIARHSEEAELRGSSAAQGNNSNNNNSSAAATTYENPGTRHLPRSPASVPTFIRVLSWNTSESESQSPLRRGRMLNDYSDGSKEGEDQQDEEEQSEEILPDWQEVAAELRRDLEQMKQELLEASVQQQQALLSSMRTLLTELFLQEQLSEPPSPANNNNNNNNSNNNSNNNKPPSPTVLQHRKSGPASPTRQQQHTTNNNNNSNNNNKNKLDGPTSGLQLRELSPSCELHSQVPEDNNNTKSKDNSVNGRLTRRVASAPSFLHRLSFSLNSSPEEDCNDVGEQLLYTHETLEQNSGGPALCEDLDPAAPLVKPEVHHAAAAPHVRDSEGSAACEGFQGGKSIMARESSGGSGNKKGSRGSSSSGEGSGGGIGGRGSQADEGEASEDNNADEGNGADRGNEANRGNREGASAVRPAERRQQQQQQQRQQQHQQKQQQQPGPLAVRGRSSSEPLAGCSRTTSVSRDGSRSDVNKNNNNNSNNSNFVPEGGDNNKSNSFPEGRL